MSQVGLTLEHEGPTFVWCSRELIIFFFFFFKGLSESVQKIKIGFKMEYQINTWVLVRVPDIMSA